VCACACACACVCDLVSLCLLHLVFKISVSLAVTNKVMINAERQKVRQEAVRWPCGVSSKGSNSLRHNSCQKWVHSKCSGIKGSMSKVAKSFIC